MVILVMFYVDINDSLIAISTTKCIRHIFAVRKGVLLQVQFDYVSILLPIMVTSSEYLDEYEYSSSTSTRLR